MARSTAVNAALWSAVVFGIAGLFLGALVGSIYDPSVAWLTSLIGSAEAGLFGAAIGGAVGYAYTQLRSKYCRHEPSRC